MKPRLLVVVTSILPLMDELWSPATRNFLILLADDVKFVEMGFTGTKVQVSPHLEGLANTVVFLTQAYCSAPSPPHSFDHCFGFL